MKLKFELVDARGKIRLWNMPEKASLAIQLKFGLAYPVCDLNYDRKTGTGSVWVEAVSAASGTKTKQDIDRHGRPNMYISGKLINAGKQLLASDKVKYLPVETESFYPQYVGPENRKVRNAVAAILVNGTPSDLETNAVSPVESRDYAQKLVTKNELLKLLVTVGASPIRRKQILEMVYYELTDILETSERAFGVESFRVGLYRDYNSGDYTLAFQYWRHDQSMSNSWKRFLRQSSVGLAALLEREIQSTKNHLQDLQFAGMGTGGELAIFGSLGSGILAFTYNTVTFSEEQILKAITTYDPKQKKVVELPQAGSLERMGTIRLLIRSYHLEETPFRIFPGEFPIESSH